MFVGKFRQKFVSCYVAVVQSSWIIVVDSLFKKSPQKKKSDGVEIWGLWWPKPTPENSITVSVTAVVIFAVWTVTPSGCNQLPFYFLPAEQRIESEKFDNVRFNSIYIFEFLWPHCGPTLFVEALRTKHQSLRMRRIFVQFVWVLSTPYSLVVTINSSIPVDPCLSRDNQIV